MYDVSNKFKNLIIFSPKPLIGSLLGHYYILKKLTFAFLPPEIQVSVKI